MNNPAHENSVADMAMSVLGLSHLAYIRPVSEGSETGFAVCAADGTQLAIFSTQEAAFFSARQHDLEPVQLH